MEFLGERIVIDYPVPIADDLRLFAAAAGVSEAELRVDVERIIARHLARYFFAERLLAARGGGISILDVACGSGYGTYVLSGRGTSSQRSVIGVDLDPEAVKYATAQFVRPDLNLEYRQADCRALPWDGPTFDAIVSFETLEHVTRDEGTRFVEQLAGLLRPGGLLVISTPAPRPEVGNPFHHHEYELPELEALLTAHFAHRRLFDQGFISGSAILPHSARAADSAPASARERIERQAPLTPHPTVFAPGAGVAPRPAVRHHVAVCSHDAVPAEIASAIVCFEPELVDVKADHLFG